MTTEIEQLAALLQTSRNIVFFGGAGVSTESGIPDFRSAQGLWNDVNVNEKVSQSLTKF